MLYLNSETEDIRKTAQIHTHAHTRTQTHTNDSTIYALIRWCIVQRTLYEKSQLKIAQAYISVHEVTYQGKTANWVKMLDIVNKNDSMSLFSKNPKTEIDLLQKKIFIKINAVHYPAKRKAD